MDVRGPYNGQSPASADLSIRGKTTRIESNDELLQEAHVRSLEKSESSAEIVDLMSRLKALPEIRQDVVRNVGQQLLSGSLLTRSAAEDTAAEILKKIGTV